MEHLIGILGIVLIFGAIVVFHEFGHFIVAKLSGMEVYEFSIGLGPAIIKRKVGDTFYSLRCVPVGGFVRIAGMEPGEEDSPRGYDKKPFFAKFGTLIAGVTMNFVLALVIVTGVGMAVGYMKPGNKVIVAGVMQDSPAAKVGIMAGDQLLRVKGLDHLSIDGTREFIGKSHGAVTLTVLRNGKELTFAPTPKKMPTVQQRGLIYHMTTYKGIGVVFSMSSGKWQRLGLIESAKQGVLTVAGRTVDAFAQFLSLVTGHIPVNKLSGPPEIMRVAYNAATSAMVSRVGVFNMFQTMAFLSVLVGFFNLLPLPALDGGRLFFLVIEGIRRKPMAREREELIHAIGMIVLLGLIVLISINDIWKMFGGK